MIIAALIIALICTILVYIFCMMVIGDSLEASTDDIPAACMIVTLIGLSLVVLFVFSTLTPHIYHLIV